MITLKNGKDEQKIILGGGRQISEMRFLCAAGLNSM
jgi:hypothetical protein